MILTQNGTELPAASFIAEGHDEGQGHTEQASDVLDQVPDHFYYVSSSPRIEKRPQPRSTVIRHTTLANPPDGSSGSAACGWFWRPHFSLDGWGLARCKLLQSFTSKSSVLDPSDGPSTHTLSISSQLAMPRQFKSLRITLLAYLHEASQVNTSSAPLPLSIRYAKACERKDQGLVLVRMPEQAMSYPGTHRRRTGVLRNRCQVRYYRNSRQT